MKTTYEDAIAIGFAFGGAEMVWAGDYFGVLPLIFIGLPMIFACVTGFVLNRVKEASE